MVLTSVPMQSLVPLAGPGLILKFTAHYLAVMSDA